MAIINLLQDIIESTNDIINLDFQVIKNRKDYVPGYEDPSLSFERGKVKRSKTICTCVLYADIRNSTTLSHNHTQEDMSRLYTAFVKGLLKIADVHGGVVRNIIGDRVMIIFPEENCFKNAIDAAVSINTVSKYIINRLFTNLKFEVGVGIDYGEMMVIKAGIPKREPERTNYKNLIWIGKPANIASKLTDLANKKVETLIFKVTYYPLSLNWFLRRGEALKTSYGAVTSKYSSIVTTVSLSEKEFAARIGWSDVTGVTYLGGKFVKFEKIKETTDDPPILMSEAVFDGYKEQNPNDPSIINNHYTLQKIKIKDYKGVIYGGDLHWTAKKNLNFNI